MSLARMTNMIIGGYELSEMGLDNSSLTNEVTNFFIYFTFLILMTIISVNLLTGIAIGELESVLKEAEIYNIQQRIVYILHIQKIIFNIQNRIEKLLKIKQANILIRFMKFNKEDKNKDLAEKSSIRKRIWAWFKRNAEPEMDFIEKSDKDIEDFFNEAQYNARIERDFISNKMNEHEYKLASIAESLETQRIEQMKKINEIDLSVSKNEKQLSEIAERLEDQMSQMIKKGNESDENVSKKLV